LQVTLLPAGVLRKAPLQENVKLSGNRPAGER
jgi:hypothetical protein